MRNRAILKKLNNRMTSITIQIINKIKLGNKIKVGDVYYEMMRVSITLNGITIINKRISTVLGHCTWS